MLTSDVKTNIKRASASVLPLKNKKIKREEDSMKKNSNDDSDLTESIVKKKSKSKLEKTLKTKRLSNGKLPSKARKLNKTGNPLKINTIAASEGKPNWIEIKQEKKLQKASRKEKKHGLEIYELSIKVKSLWEKLRTKATTKDKKDDICKELFALVKNDMHLLIHSHDLARVIQSLIKYGTPEMHTYISDKLCQCLAKAASSKYGRFCVKAALKKCSPVSRKKLIQSAFGNVVKLFCHQFGNSVIDEMYTVWAHGNSKRTMRMEFYGDLGKLLNITSDKKYFLQNLPEDLKPAILTSTKLNINKALAKENLLNSSLLHAVLSDFLRSCDPSDREEILESLHTKMEHLLTSKEGEEVAILTLWYGSNKMKKVAVKSIKGKVQHYAQSKYGHSFIMAMFDSVDDTVLINKVIIPELLADLDTLLSNAFGRQVILYLVAHRDPAYFNPKQLGLLSQGDSVRNSKKDSNQRLKELLTVVSTNILEKMCTDPSIWFRNGSTALVMLAVLKSAEDGDILHSVYKALVEYILNPDSKIEITEAEGKPSSIVHVVEASGVHMALKKLMIHEKSKANENLNTFAACLVESLNNESISLLLQSNRGTFTLVFLLENGGKDTIIELKSKVNKALKKINKNTDSKGLNVLMKKLKE